MQRSGDQIIAPQYYNSGNDTYEVSQGSNGATKVQITDTSGNAFGNTDGVIFSSGQRSGTQVSSIIQNPSCRGVILYLRITASSGTGGLSPVIWGVDPASGQFITLNAVPEPVVGTRNYTYVLYPGASLDFGLTAVQVESLPLPKQWGVQVWTGDSSNYTYSLGYSLIL